MPHTANEFKNIDTGLASLILIARFHSVSADPENLTHQFGTGQSHFNTLSLIRAARYLELKAKEVDSTWDKLQKTSLPVIAQHKDGRYFIIVKVDGEKALIHDPLEKKPLTLPRKILEDAWNGKLILVMKQGFQASAIGKFDISWFIPAIKKHKKVFSEVLLASFFIQLFALVTPLFFQVIIDKVLVHKGLTTLTVLAIGLLVVSFFDVFLNGLRTYVLSHTVNKIDVSLGAKLFNHLLKLPIGYFQSRAVGNTVARVKELDTIREFITSSALTLSIDLFFTIIFFVVMYYYSPTLTWIVMASLPFYILLSIVITPILHSRLNEKFQRGAANQAFLVEAVNGIETLKAMAVEPQMQRKWEDQLSAYVTSAFRANNLSNIAGQIAQFVNKVVTVLILWVGATLVIGGSLSVGQLIAFNMIASRVNGPILKLVQLWQDFQQAGISVERLGDILNSPTEPVYDTSRTTLPRIQGEVRFDYITFRYRNGLPAVLNNIEFTAKQGEVIGIVGRSGSGKSTLAKLIQRLYVPEEGRVLIDGVDLAQVDTAWLRRQIGVVLQENILFNCSVKENISFTDPGLPMERVIQAARLAGAHEFVLELPEGYDTQVGEHGSNLSGGQRQRLAIARALISNPRILIFDEATSALDYESERIIQNNMRSICQDRTVFIIAHRLSTVRESDRIIVIDHGRIVEQGGHDDLLAQGGQYAQLYAHQSGKPTGLKEQKQ